MEPFGIVGPCCVQERVLLIAAKYVVHEEPVRCRAMPSMPLSLSNYGVVTCKRHVDPEFCAMLLCHT